MVERQETTDSEKGVRTGAGSAGRSMGKKIGLYGCAFIILAVLILFVLMNLIGLYNPFPNMEGVGP